MKTNLKIMLRMLLRSKGYSFINIAGLAVGIASAALILLWVEDEITFNNFPQKDHLYAVYENQTYGDDIHTFHVAPGPLGPVLKDEITGIKNVLRLQNNEHLFEAGEQRMNESGTFCDASIFSMLDIQFLSGDVATAFSVGRPIVISQKMAGKFFGSNDPIGQTLKMNHDKEYQITGVYADIRKNSSFKFEWMVPFDVYINDLRNSGQNFVDMWGANWYSIYVALEPTASLAAVNEQIFELIPQKSDGNVTNKLFLYPLNRMHLYGNFKDGKETGEGFISTVRMFAGIAVIILLIACINFVNLSTARSQKRALEVGVRKTFGARRPMLVSQFMLESVWMTLLSVIVAVLIIALVLPSFSTMIGKQLSMELGKPSHILGLLGVGILCCLMAGSYPAFYLSSFPPIDVLRKIRSKTGSAAWFRKSLVVFQFSVSLILIICTAFIYLQVQYTKNRSLGMNIEQVLTIDASDDVKKNYAPLKQALMATGLVDNAALSSQQMIRIWNNAGGFNWPGKPDDVSLLISRISGSSELLPTMGIELLEGRDFENDNIETNNRYVIINETLAKYMGDEGHVGGRIRQGDGEYNEVVAVIKDFVFNNAYRTDSEPVLIHMDPNAAYYLFLRLKPGNMQTSVEQIAGVMKRFNPGYPFEYKFMDERFEQMFRSELLVGKLSVLFAALAIFISSLGLFGLAAFSAEQRTREIGIRKVLGASVWGITSLLGRNFMVQVLISFVIAIPIAWWMMHSWLQKFPYRVDESWVVFAVSCLLVTLIAIFTVSFQSIKAATANPVKSLKTE